MGRDDLPFGPGSLQWWIDGATDDHYFTLRERRELWPWFHSLAVFDVVANNADRKSGHVLIDGDDALVGGAGVDTADYSAESADIDANLDDGIASGSSIGTDLIASVENLTGGSGDDELRGDEFVNIILGGDGDDALYGTEGTDTLDGEGGSDTINGTPEP